MTRRSAVAALGGVWLAAAADFWKEKPAAEWSVKDAHRLRERSPWARVANVELQSGGMRAPGGGRGGRRGGGGAMDASVSNNDMGAQVRPGAGAGGLPTEGLPPMPEIVVRWESAKPMQEASAMEEAPLAKQIGKLAERFYVISVAGMALPGGGGAPGQSPQERARAIEQRLQKATALKRKGKPDLAPDQVGMVQTPKGPMLVFLFSREAKLAAEDKEVVFESSAGPMKVKSKFHLKDMLYRGELAL